MLEVSGQVKKHSVFYRCPFCRKMHNHGHIPGETILHRVSHCPVNETSVVIKI